MTLTDLQTLPLFPLNTVLFPGGILHLRIFETRYLDLVSACLRTDSGFGVVAIQEGTEAGAPPASIYPVGTVARIVDFNPLNDGLLGITCKGGQRFRVISQSIQSNQQLTAEVLGLPEDARLPPLPQHEPLLLVFRELLKTKQLATFCQLHTLDWDDAAWIGQRLAEILALPLSLRQTLLEMTDPQQRLDCLLAILRKHYAPKQP